MNEKAQLNILTTCFIAMYTLTAHTALSTALVAAFSPNSFKSLEKFSRTREQNTHSDRLIKTKVERSSYLCFIFKYTIEDKRRD